MRNHALPSSPVHVPDRKTFSCVYNKVLKPFFQVEVENSHSSIDGSISSNDNKTCCASSSVRLNVDASHCATDKYPFRQLHLKA
eukprot:m.149583 g.149583  ORF g.149583 m.149583 type:complete len:84 (+) comp15017_c0_seq5:2389-2640(+)